jgi:hypothetical protein
MRHLSGKVVLVVTAMAAGAMLAAAQAPAQKLSFEVASVKVNKSGPSGTSIGLRGNGFYLVNASCREKRASPSTHPLHSR